MNKLDLRESGRTQGTGKRRRAKLISADVWGTTAYYPAEILERDASEVFVPGIKMYENHFTSSEEMERPEGDVSRLVGKLISHGVYEADNPEGPGVYADVEFYDSYVDRINEIGGDIGLSIAGHGDYVEGERDGRYGKIITELMNIKSVDIVTAAGAGGKLVSILESAGPMAGTPIETEGDQSVTALTQEQFEEGIAQLKESIKGALSESVEGLGVTLSTALKEALVPQPVETAATEAVDTEGAETKIEEAARPAEVEINHEELMVKFAESQLPVAVLPSVVAKLKEGASIEDAIEAQTKLREAFEEQHKASHVKITEAKQGATGDRRSRVLEILNS